jgi:hypothetical protein
MLIIYCVLLLPWAPAALIMNGMFDYYGARKSAMLWMWSYPVFVAAAFRFKRQPGLILLPLLTPVVLLVVPLFR